MPSTFDEVRSNLRPKIWLRSAFTKSSLRRQIEGKKQFDSPIYLLGSHLVSTVVYHLPTAMRSLSQENFDNWNVTYFEALEVACHNLAETSIAYSKIGEGFHSAVSGDNYDSSRILLKDKISAWHVDGDVVAMVPQRDAMYVAGSQDNTSLKIMLDLTES